MNPGQTHFTSDMGEALEDIGSTDGKRIFLLNGDPANPNLTFFITCVNNTDVSPKCIRFYGVGFLPSEFEPDGNGFKFKPSVVVPATKDVEKIMVCRFVDWMVTISGVGRLVAHRYTDL